MRASGERIVIDGPCLSACTLVVSMVPRDRISGRTREKGLTLVPTRLYFKDGRVKIELAVARGKERIDKRRDLAERDARRQIERALKSRR